MDDKEKASTKITVSSACDIDVAASIPKITIEKDEALSITECFDQSKPYYFRVYHNASSIDVFATTGNIRREGDSYEEIEEIVTFSCSDTASTSKPLDSLLSSQWLGASLGNVSVQGNGDLKISESGYGVLRIIYRSYYEIYSLEANIEGKVLIVATIPVSDCSDATASATHEIEMGCAEGQKSIRFTVRDYGTGEPVPFATVIFQGQSYSTDQFGATQIIQNVPFGTYDVRAIKYGYIPSETDTLNNDKITIS